MDRSLLESKIRGCWAGKGIGGTLGMPYEGVARPLTLDRTSLCSAAVPNDDLELQMLWLVWVEKYGVGLRSHHLTEAWKHYTCLPDEYGIAQWNMARGMQPPLSGIHNNWFGDGMGAAIRSELWACLCPGRPALAAAFAREDAIVDHHGNGVWAEMFLAAAESAAFECESPLEAIQTGLTYIARDCRVSHAVRFVCELHAAGVPPHAVRDDIMARFGSDNFTDVSMNLAFIVFGLLYGNGDFETSVLMSVNCGMDTDCTGATSAAFLGILMGEEGIPADWRRTVGDELVVSECLQSLPLPKTVDEATERVMALAVGDFAALSDSPAGMTADAAGDPIDDGHSWLVFCDPVATGYAREPDDVARASVHPEDFTERVLRSAGIHLNLDSFIEAPGDTLYLLTQLRVPEDLDGQLMICASTGLTAWLDGRAILNYHGRRELVPAFHRTEGGASIPVQLAAGRWYHLKIRLLSCHAPLRLTVALGATDGRYACDVVYSATAV
ncbi:MAG: ADP-ribosylglycohydrolase family protein [Lentisphaerae bacterium]|nr:ADP-ribosylglycohydrolase family protein [Lentisphaerota bacterium]